MLTRQQKSYRRKKEWLKKQPEDVQLLHITKRREEHRRWYKNNKAQSLRESYTFRREHPEHMLFIRARNRAASSRIEFSIEKEDIIVPLVCPYLGIELKVGHEDSRRASPSLDRIDNSKGYIRGNIEVISQLANSMKAHSTKEELITFSKSVLRRFNV